MDLNDVFTVMQQSDKAAQESNPFSPLQSTADSIGQILIKAIAERASTGTMGKNDMRDAILGSLATGLIGGAAENFGNSYVSDQNEAVNATLAEALSGKTPTRPSGMSASVFAPISRAGAFFRAQQTQDVVDEERKAKQQLTSSLLNQLPSAASPQERSRIISTLSAISGDTSSANPAAVDATSGPTIGNPATQMSLVQRLQADEAANQVKQVAPKQTDLQDFGPDVGAQSLEDIEKRMFAENLATGMPTVQAATSAKTAVNDLRQRSKTLVGKKLADEADTISQIEDIIRTGESGLAKAGDTGSWVGSQYEKVLSYFPNAFPEAATQAAGDKDLEVTKNLGAAINRIKGSGSLSDMESKALFATALSPYNTKVQNQDILERYKIGLSQMKDHSGFMNYFLDKTGGNPEMAQQMWDIYKEQNPVAVQDEKGGYVANENRVPWQKFDFVGSYKDYMTNGRKTPNLESPAQAPAAAQAQGITEGATATNPNTGQKIMFKNGQWVAM